MSDHEIKTSVNTLLHKVAETNQFLALEAKESLTKLSESVPAAKAIQFLHPFYKDKQVPTRRAVSNALLTIMNTMGAINIYDLPQQ